MERKIYFRIDETRVKCKDCREIVSSDNTVLKSELVNALEERAVNKPKIAAECQGTTHSQSEEEEVDKRQSEMSVVTVTEEKENTENNEGMIMITSNKLKTEGVDLKPKTETNLNIKKNIGKNKEKFITEKLYPHTL
ncbi:hypothetical protein JTB14_015585 [Gonioctena quinquepunctata]|nr:hypothetical protein JTB14_015585 [Gonioctena quinquepunctata]